MMKRAKTMMKTTHLWSQEDEETGLYYNRFRYYDPRIGNYISQDPIRLGGSNPTLYAYVHDSNSWIDLFGLKLITVYHYTSKKGYNIITIKYFYKHYTSLSEYERVT